MSGSEAFHLDLPAGRRLHGRLHRAALSGRRPTVVICHGFKGFMDWGFFPYLAELLAERGFTSILFNFSGSGMIPGDELVTDIEAFRQACFSQDLEDLEGLIATLGVEVGEELIDRSRLALVGHSRGGGAALLAASRPQPQAEIRALATWAAVSTFDRLGSEEKRLWRERGAVPVVNSRTGQELEIGVAVLDDLERLGEELSLTAAAARRTAPWLIVHGEKDETVPLEEARLLHGCATSPVELLVLPGAGHTFGAVHPFRGPTPELIRAFNATLAWLRQNLP
jgi:pimeloyl-ACP methyl ester carboxylesterase